VFVDSGLDDFRQWADESTVLDRYLGKYRLASIGTFAVVREGSQLYVQPEGQPRLALFAETEKEFFCKTEDAQITFSRYSKSSLTGSKMPIVIVQIFCFTLASFCAVK
jgi:hypothetical protein